MAIKALTHTVFSTVCVEISLFLPGNRITTIHYSLMISFDMVVSAAIPCSTANATAAKFLTS